MEKQQERGKLIVFEGVEGCGKTTQLRSLRDWLMVKGWQEIASLAVNTSSAPKFLVTREPGGTELGGKLRQLLLDGHHQEIQERAELLLYAADRAQHVAELLQPHLARGTIILCDRYTDSTVAYQGKGRGLSLPLITQLNQVATGGLESDLTLWLDVDVEIGLSRTRQRGAADRMEKANLAFHQRVQQGYQELAQTHPHRIVRIDAGGTPEAVQQQVSQVISQRFAEWNYQLLPH